MIRRISALGHLVAAFGWLVLAFAVGMSVFAGMVLMFIGMVLVFCIVALLAGPLVIGMFVMLPVSVAVTGSTEWWGRLINRTDPVMEWLVRPLDKGADGMDSVMDRVDPWVDRFLARVDRHAEVLR